MILNSQPQVSYALMDLMVKINAVNMEVFQVSYSPPLFASRGFTWSPTENSFIIWRIPNSDTRPANTNTGHPHRAYARSQTTTTATIPRLPSSTSRFILTSEPPNSGISPSASPATPCGTASSSAGHRGVTPSSPDLARRSKGAIHSTTWQNEGVTPSL